MSIMNAQDLQELGLPPCPDGFVAVECIIKHETEKAYLIQVDEEVGEDGVDIMWIPSSQVHSDHPRDSGKAYIYISRWIAGVKGFDV
jgi:hypothetical protein